MTDPSHGDHADDPACREAIAQVQAFLHDELPVSAADVIRAHLNACEKCLSDFDTEAEIGRLLRRSHACGPAPSTLRIRVTQMRIQRG